MKFCWLVIGSEVLVTESALVENARFPEESYEFILPGAVHEISGFTTSMPVLVTVSLFYFNGFG